jgi:hypothetical protein
VSPNVGLADGARVPDRRVGETGIVLLIDEANVVGSRPTGWWRDRPGAEFVLQRKRIGSPNPLSWSSKVLLAAASRRGIADGVRVLHAPGSGDDMLIAVATDAAGHVTLVSADRALRQRAEALGARVAGPGWLIDLLDA